MVELLALDPLLPIRVVTLITVQVSSMHVICYFYHFDNELIKLTHNFDFIQCEHFNMCFQLTVDGRPGGPMAPAP